MYSEVLKKYWGYDGFRGMQEPAINSIVADKEDIFFLAPTSLGKSAVFQVAALCLEGTTIVVSPLIALMQDQINRLESLGIVTATLNSDMGVKDKRKAFDKLKSGTVKLFYVAPETLLNQDVINFLTENVTVSFIAIDECHVVSVWGNSFRPTYRDLGELRAHFPNAPMAALTATLCPQGVEDVIQTLNLKNPKKYIHNLDRSSIVYNIFHKTNVSSQILDIVKNYGSDACGIIYCMTKEKTESVAQFLNSYGIKCKPYHAGLGKKVKQQVLSEYLDKSLNLIVATIAFGMGIDRGDVRYVIHESVPSNIENYMQETGRASRDGLLSQTYLLYSPTDVRTQLWMVQQSIRNPDRLRITTNKIRAFKLFCETLKCRREGMLAFFDQTPIKCGQCDVCLRIWFYYRKPLQSQ